MTLICQEGNVFKMWLNANKFDEIWRKLIKYKNN